MMLMETKLYQWLEEEVAKLVAEREARREEKKLRGRVSEGFRLAGAVAAANDAFDASKNYYASTGASWTRCFS